MLQTRFKTESIGITANEFKQKHVSRSNRYHDAKNYELLKNWKLAGHDRITNPGCGLVKHVYSCGCKKTHDSTVLRCGRLGCPICSKHSASRKAKKLAMELGKLMYIDKETVRHYSINCQIDFDIDYYTEYVEKRNEIVNILKEEGLKQGILILHAYRLNKDDSGLRKSFHFHYVGTGKLLDSAEFYKKYGFNYSNHSVDDKRIYTINKIKTVISYLLDHCAIWAYKPSFYRMKMGKTKTKTTKYVEKCSTCGDDLCYVHRDSYVLLGDKPDAETFKQALANNYVPDDPCLQTVMHLPPQPFYHNDNLRIYFDKEIRRDENYKLWKYRKHVKYKGYTISDKLYELPDYIEKQIRTNNYQPLIHSWEQNFIEVIKTE